MQGGNGKGDSNLLIDSVLRSSNYLEDCWYWCTGGICVVNVTGTLELAGWWRFSWIPSVSIRFSLGLEIEWTRPGRDRGKPTNSRDQFLTNERVHGRLGFPTLLITSRISPTVPGWCPHIYWKCYNIHTIYGSFPVCFEVHILNWKQTLRVYSPTAAQAPQPRMIKRAKRWMAAENIFLAFIHLDACYIQRGETRLSQLRRRVLPIIWALVARFPT